MFVIGQCLHKISGSNRGIDAFCHATHLGVVLVYECMDCDLEVMGLRPVPGVSMCHTTHLGVMLVYVYMGCEIMSLRPGPA